MYCKRVANCSFFLFVLRVNSKPHFIYKLNSFGYDFQLLTANYFDDIVVGGGWAGNIKGAGFKVAVTGR